MLYSADAGVGKVAGIRLDQASGEMTTEFIVEATTLTLHYRLGETSFDFLGFEFRWGMDRKGQARLKRRTSRKKLRSSIKRVAEWCKKNRHRRVREQFKLLNAKLRGYYNYYGVRGNYDRA